MRRGRPSPSRVGAVEAAREASWSRELLLHRAGSAGPAVLRRPAHRRWRSPTLRASAFRAARPSAGGAPAVLLDRSSCVGLLGCPSFGGQRTTGALRTKKTQNTVLGRRSVVAVARRVWSSDSRRNNRIQLPTQPAARPQHRGHPPQRTAAGMPRHCEYAAPTPQSAACHRQHRPFGPCRHRCGGVGGVREASCAAVVAHVHRRAMRSITMPSVAANPSFERTVFGGRCPPKPAAQLQRYAPKFRHLALHVERCECAASAPRGQR
jgi:hypothetical protein